MAETATVQGGRPEPLLEGRRRKTRRGPAGKGRNGATAAARHSRNEEERKQSNSKAKQRGKDKGRGSTDRPANQTIKQDGGEPSKRRECQGP